MGRVIHNQAEVRNPNSCENQQQISPPSQQGSIFVLQQIHYL